MVDKTTDNKIGVIGLYRSNYLAQYHVREMGKLLKKSHVTLLPHLKALERDKILTAKIAGKNKNYSLNFDNSITKNYLALSEIVETTTLLEEIFLIKKMASEMLKLYFPGTMVLFGSYAKRTFKDDSDIDIFYLGSITEKMVQELKKIGKVYGKTVNIKKSSMKNFEVGLRKKDPLIIEIIKYHIILQNPQPFINALWKYHDEK